MICVVTISKESALRSIADIFTISRFLLAGLFVWYGLIYKEEATSTVIFGIIIGWTLDVMDGVFGRLSGQKGLSWASQHDFLADMVMVYGSLVFFTLAGYVPKWIFAAYTLLAAILIKKYPVKAVVMTIATPAVACLWQLPFYMNHF